jgi:hypothetical protein
MKQLKCIILILITEAQEITDFGVPNAMATLWDRDFFGCGSDFCELLELPKLSKIFYIGL